MLRRKIWLVIGIASAVLVIGVGSLAFYLSHRLRDVKGPLIRALQSQIDGELKVGEATVVVFPAGLDLKDIQLYAPGEQEPSATIKVAELRFDLIPLVRKKIQGKLNVIEPEIFLRRTKDGKTNMERIFAPLISGESKERVSAVDQLWWKRLAIDRLRIKDARFLATREGSEDKVELKDIDVAADRIRFDGSREPAKIKISYSLPQVSKEPMKISTQMRFDEAIQGLRLEEGTVLWGETKMNFGGPVLLPGEKNKEVGLDLAFDAPEIDLKKFGAMLAKPIPATGKMAMKGTVKGSAFEPKLDVTLDSPALNVAGKSLSKFHAELSKKEKPVEIRNTSFGIYGGTIQLSGEAVPGPVIPAKLNVGLRSLSIAAATGKPSPASLSGDLQLTSPNVSNPNSFSGGGKISAGPFPLPVVNLQNKVKVAQILAAGTAVGQMVNVGMLSSSANVIGTQVDRVNAAVRINGNNVTLAPFNLGNGHFTASGNATIANQQSINGGGTFNLSPGVTSSLITDARLRQSMTGGRGGLAVPFSISGPLADPNISVDSGYIQGLVSKATAAGLTNMLMGGVKPEGMLNEALKNTPLGDPKNPLGQILGGTSQTPTNTNSKTTSGTTTRRTTTTSTTTQQNTQKKQPTLQKGIEGLLFGK
ncbi:MAG TPA: hypothetical protein VJP40_09815 [bacterium]|nr:hypothetical protein [bacterium]